MNPAIERDIRRLNWGLIGVFLGMILFDAALVYFLAKWF